MTLCRCHEADSAVAMCLVVPVRQLGDPAPSGQQILEPLDRQLGAVLQRSERRLHVRIVVAHGLPASRVGHAQALHGGEHGFAFHVRAIVRVHRQLARANVLPRADVSQQLAGQLGTLAVKHLPANDLAAEQVLGQVQVKVLAAHLGRQIRDIPAKHLIGSGRGQGARAAALLRCTLCAPMSQLPLLSQQPVHRGFGRHIDAAVSQARHGLAGRQVLERFAVEHSHHDLSFFLAQLVGRACVAPLARWALAALGRTRALLALHTAPR